ncbi:hypothetical protein NKH77_29705 [Streptomyces sp. M19]
MCSAALSPSPFRPTTSPPSPARRGRRRSRTVCASWKPWTKRSAREAGCAPSNGTNWPATAPPCPVPRPATSSGSVRPWRAATRRARRTWRPCARSAPRPRARGGRPPRGAAAPLRTALQEVRTRPARGPRPPRHAALRAHRGGPLAAPARRTATAATAAGEPKRDPAERPEPSPGEREGRAAVRRARPSPSRPVPTPAEVFPPKRRPARPPESLVACPA